MPYNVFTVIKFIVFTQKMTAIAIIDSRSKASVLKMYSSESSVAIVGSGYLYS